MKRPKQIVTWLPVESRKTDWVDWNGKPTDEYYVKIPLWIVRAYRLHRKLLPVKITIKDTFTPMSRKSAEEKKSGLKRYFKENWLKKVIKMRKLNNNYIKFLE